MRSLSDNTLTAVVPTKGRPEFLGEAVLSIAAQVSPPNEVIVVDDAGELSAVRTIVRQILPVATVVTSSHAHGASSARNEGVLRASGSYIAFLDDDDKWLPMYLCEIRAVLASSSPDVVCADFLEEIAPGSLRPEKTAPEQLSATDFLVKNPGLRASNLVIRRDLFLAIGGFDETLPSLNDLDIGIRLSLRDDIAYERLPKRLVIFRQHSGPRLSTPRSAAKRLGVSRFYARHQHLMTETDRARFKRHVARIWGVDEMGGLLS